MEVCGIGTDDGNALVLALREWQQVVLILEKNDRFVSGFQGELLMLCIVGDFFRGVGIDVRIIEKA
jgi:hypothetical protein